MSSTQQPISDIVDYYNLLAMQNPGKAAFHSPSTGDYPKYIRYEEDPYYDLVAPNPPTAAAIKRAQFVDKTYKWVGK